MQQKQNEKLLRLWQIIGDQKRNHPPMIPVSRSTWLNGVRDGKYPKPVKISERCVVWRESDIRDLIQNGGVK